MKVHMKMLPVEKVNRKPGPKPNKRFQKSVEEMGVIQPIIVVPGEFDTFDIYAGRRRTESAYLCGLEHIPAVVCAAETDKDFQFMKEYITLIENNHRSANPAADLDAVKTLMLKGNLTEEEIAQNCNMDLGRIRRIAKLFNLCEDAMYLLRDGSLREKPAMRLAHLPKEKQLEVINASRIEGEDKVNVRTADIETAIREHNMSAAQPAINGLESYMPQLTDPILIKFEEFASMLSTSSAVSDEVAHAINVIRASLRGETRKDETHKKAA